MLSAAGHSTPGLASAAAARMTNDAPSQSLLEELDARQNELLDELDRLNARIEQVLNETMKWRGTLPAPVALPAAA